MENFCIFFLLYLTNQACYLYREIVMIYTNYRVYVIGATTHFDKYFTYIVTKPTTFSYPHRVEPIFGEIYLEPCLFDSHDTSRFWISGYYLPNAILILFLHHSYLFLWRAKVVHTKK